MPTYDIATHFDVYFTAANDDPGLFVYDTDTNDVPTGDDRRAALVKLRTAINRELDDDCTRAHYHPHHHDDELYSWGPDEHGTGDYYLRPHGDCY